MYKKVRFTSAFLSDLFEAKKASGFGGGFNPSYIDHCSLVVDMSFEDLRFMVKEDSGDLSLLRLTDIFGEDSDSQLEYALDRRWDLEDGIEQNIEEYTSNNCIIEHRPPYPKPKRYYDYRCSEGVEDPMLLPTIIEATNNRKDLTEKETAHYEAAGFPYSRRRH